MPDTSQKMTNHWLAIVGSLQAVRTFEARAWWCLPQGAEKGDTVLLYCPASVSARSQGVFGDCRVKETPRLSNPKGFYCSGYGGTFGRTAKLLYADLEFLQRFPNRLSAKQMKRDTRLRNANFVRRNFQGTSFKITDADRQRMLKLLGNEKSSESFGRHGENGQEST